MQAGEGEAESDTMMRPSNPSVYNPHRSAAGGGRRTKGFIILAVILVVVCLFAVPSLSRGGKGLRGSAVSGLQEKVAADKWKIMLISDLDKNSKVDEGKRYRSILQSGTLNRDPASGKYTATFGDAVDLYSGHNEAGRGMELSELISYEGALLAVDDRTGIVFEIVDYDEGERHMAPRYILPEGDGLVDKGMKLEWATIKDGSLVVGSFGKEYTDDAGHVVSMNNNWVIFIDADGGITREDWTQQYNKLREKAGAEFPGYMIHESAAWSDELKKWVFMPRRISAEKYDDVKDEKMGSNVILIADEDFRNVRMSHAGNVVPTHGFSSFKFVPGTGDQVVVALKSEENDEQQTQDTFIMVFTLEGEVLLEETEVPGESKFEGIEILTIPAAEEDPSGGNRQ